MTEAMLREIDYFVSLVGKRQVKSIFFGGGTPSLMDAKTVAAVLDHINLYFTLIDDVEITLEANPTSVEAGKFADFSHAGINRVSLGIQAFNDNDLKALGREHSVDEALSAIKISQKYFKRSTFDLIYARMGQSTKEWQQELEYAIELANGHLSLYQLTIEKGTPFYGQWRQGKLNIPNEDVSAEMYELTNDICENNNYPAYEISNYATTGEQSRHNMTYWQYDDYLGIGAGAHGRIAIDGKSFATQQNKKPETWLNAVQKNGHGTKIIEPLSQTMMAQEMIMMGLRLTQGINYADFEGRIGASIEGFIENSRLKFLKDQEFVDPDCPDVLRLTKRGRPLLNQILGQILT